MKINPTVFDGLQGYEILTEKWHMTVITQCGPRIAFLGKAEGGRNLLYWNQDGAVRGDWRLCGGHRVWITRPYADESEDTYASDNEACSVEILENGLRAMAPAHPFTKLERGIEVQVLADDTFQVTNIIRNTSDFIYSGGVWSPTCITPDDCVMRIPLGEDDSTWDLIKIIIPRKFAGNTVQINDSQVEFTEKEMIVRPNGILTKRCVCAPKGEISVEWPKEQIRFTKKTKYVRDGKYPLDGCNIAAFVGADNWMGEIETYGVEQSLRPGEQMENREVWKLEGGIS